jgi:RNase P/RNase MRP subunit p30
LLSHKSSVWRHVVKFYSPIVVGSGSGIAASRVTLRTIMGWGAFAHRKRIQIDTAEASLSNIADRLYLGLYIRKYLLKQCSAGNAKAWREG